ncbi:MAG: aminotransferase class V-fold PLP-dependent enzyme [Acidobacteriaceae bacterium]
MDAIKAANLFEVPAGITYLNCANMSPQLKSVTAAGLEGVRIKATPWTITGANWFSCAEELRTVAGKLLGTGADSVALVPAVSYGMAIAAANVEINPGDSIVLLAQDFPSNVYTWREAAGRRSARIVTVERDPDTGWTESVLRAIDERTAVVCVPRCHWMDGTLVDLVRVGERARQVGAALIVDVSQSLGAAPLDISRIQPDFLVSVGYKWQLGPYGLGYLYASPKWQQQGVPIEQSWMTRRGSSDFTRLTEYDEDFQVGARRFDMGEFTQFILAPMCAAGLQQLLDWHIASIEQSISQLTDEIAARALAAGYEVAPAEQRAKHMIGIRFRGGLPARLPAALSTAKVYVSIRGDSVRVSPHLYNTAADIDRLFAAIASSV